MTTSLYGGYNLLPANSKVMSLQAQASSATSSSARSEAPSQYSNVTENLRPYNSILEPRRSFTVQAAMQEVAHPDALAQPAYVDNDQSEQKLLQHPVLQHTIFHNNRQSPKYWLLRGLTLTWCVLQPARQQAQ